MPFRTFAWQNGTVVLEDSTPDPELRQIDEDAFVILTSSCYRALRGGSRRGSRLPRARRGLRPAAGCRGGIRRPTNGRRPTGYGRQDGSRLRTVPWQLALLALGGLVYLVGLGSSWRAGVDRRGGWLVPATMASVLVVVPLASEWPSAFRLDWSPFTLLAAALVLTLVGPLWGLWVDPTLRGWLWPTALIALPIAVVPVALVLLAIVLVWLVDLGASLAACLRKTPSGGDRPFELPSLKTTGSRV